MKWNHLFTVIPLAAIVFLASCATSLTYSAKEIHGQIVDADSDQPIEGAVVVAQWVLFEAGIGHGGHKGRLHIYETVTNKDGRYFIPAWGPKAHPPMTELDNRDPEILIFKSQYEPKTLYNHVMREGSVRFSDWDGKTVKVKRVSDEVDLEKYAARLNSFYDGLVKNMRDDYEWKQYPRMTSAVYTEYQRLKKKGLRVYRPSIPYVDGFVEP